MATWPARGQQAPEFWDQQLKGYVDLHVATDVPGYYVSDEPVNPNLLWDQFLVPITVTGDMHATFDVDFVPAGKLRVMYGATASSPMSQLPASAYTVVGRTVTVPTLVAGNQIMLEIFYDGDVHTSAPNVSTDQYTAYDDFERTVAPTTVSANLGNLVTGQAWTILRTSQYTMSGGLIWKSAKGTDGTADGTGDGLNVSCGGVNGWLEMTIDVSSTASSPAGLHARATGSTSRVQLSATQLSTRVASLNAGRLTFSQVFVKGDSQGMLMIGDTFEVFRRAGGVGPWVTVGTYTMSGSVIASAPTLMTSMDHGIRDGMVAVDGTALSKIKDFRFIAGATAPPVVS